MASKRKTMLNQQILSAKRKKIPNRHNWFDFPSDLLEIILTKLSFRNKFRFQRVCTSWLSAGKSHFSCLYRKVQFQSPSLMLPSNHVLDNSFDNIKEKLLQHVSSFPSEFIEKECLGSSNGWLVFFDKEHGKYSLFNSVLDAHINIQNLPQLQCMTKVVLWSDPIFDDDNYYGIVAIHTVDFIHSYIAYARCGDSRWSNLGNRSKPSSYDDIICRNDIVYGVTASCSVEAWKFKATTPSKIINIWPSLPQDIIESRETYGNLYMSQFYLVDSQTELFLVTRDIGIHVCDHGLVVDEGDMIDSEHQFCNFNYRTMFFHVFKLDFNKREWVQIEDIGDRMIFLGGNHSAMVQAQHAKVYEKNSVYFTDDSCELMYMDDERGGHDAGIYSLGDRSIKELFTSIQVKPPPYWVIPRLI